MSLTNAIKLSPTALSAATLLAGAAFGLGYAAGRSAEHSVSRRHIDLLNEQLVRANAANMRMWMDDYSERFRRPPEIQSPAAPSTGLQ